MTGAIGAASQITLFGGSVDVFTARRPQNVALSGSESGENRDESLITSYSPPIIMQ